MIFLKSFFVCLNIISISLKIVENHPIENSKLSSLLSTENHDDKIIFPETEEFKRLNFVSNNEGSGSSFNIEHRTYNNNLLDDQRVNYDNRLKNEKYERKKKVNVTRNDYDLDLISDDDKGESETDDRIYFPIDTIENDDDDLISFPITEPVNGSSVDYDNEKNYIPTLDEIFNNSQVSYFEIDEYKNEWNVDGVLAKWLKEEDEKLKTNKNSVTFSANQFLNESEIEFDNNNGNTTESIIESKSTSTVQEKRISGNNELDNKIITDSFFDNNIKKDEKIDFIELNNIVKPKNNNMITNKCLLQDFELSINIFNKYILISKENFVSDGKCSEDFIRIHLSWKNSEQDENNNAAYNTSSFTIIIKKEKPTEYNIKMLDLQLRQEDYPYLINEDVKIIRKDILLPWTGVQEMLEKKKKLRILFGSKVFVQIFYPEKLRKEHLVEVDNHKIENNIIFPTSVQIVMVCLGTVIIMILLVFSIKLITKTAKRIKFNLQSA